VSRDLETICHKCLHKEPHRRYATAQELADDLHRFLQGEPIRARPLGPLGRAVKWARRRPAIAALLAALLAVTLLGAAGVLWKYREARHEAFLKTHALAQAQQAEARAVAQAGAADRARRKALRTAGELRREKDKLRWQLTLSQSLSYAGQIALAEREAQLGDLDRAVGVLDWCPPEQHGWEYRHLGRRLLARFPRLTLRGHAQPLRAVAWCPTGSHLASAAGWAEPDRPGELLVWDLRRPDAPPLRLRGHTGPVAAVAFSPDGQQVLSGSGDGTVRLFDTRSGALKRTLQARAGPVATVAFAPDGTRLACGGADGSVRLWDARSGATRGWRAHPGAVAGLAFSPDGTRLASGGDRSMRLWDARTGALLHILAHAAPVRCLAFSPDGKLLASGAEGSVDLWDAATGKRLRSFTGHHPPVRCLAFRPDGRTLASAGGIPGDRNTPSEMRLWDVHTGARLLVRPGPGTSVAFSPDGGRLVSAGGDQLRVWDVRAGSEALVLRGHLERLEAVAFSPDGQTLASAGFDPGIKLWDGHTGVERRTLHGHTARVGALAFSPAGKVLASGSADQTVRLWDVARAVLRRTLPTRFGRGLAFSPDGKHLACGETDNLIGIWDVDKGSRLLTLRGHTSAVWCLAFSPDGKLLASGGHDNTVRLWDAHRGTHLRDLGKHGSHILRLAFDRAGTRLLSFGQDYTLREWDLAGREVRAVSLRIAPLFWDVAFSPDGRRLAGAGHDGSVRLWDTVTGIEMLTLRGPADRVTSVAFSPDGTRLAGVSHDRTVRLWDARPAVDARAWHNQQAGLAEQDRDWFAARFHLDRLLAADPEQPSLCARRGRALMELGQTQRGLAELARPLLRQDEDFDVLSWHARACLARGDGAGYRQARTALVRGFGASPDRARVGVLARLAVLAAGTPAEMLPAWRLAATIRATRTGSHGEYAVIGAALLRTGQLPEAIAWLKQARTLRLLAREEVPADELLLALAYARQGQMRLARRWLALVDTWLAGPHLPAARVEVALVGLGAGGPLAALAPLPRLTASGPDPRVRGVGWERWLEIQLLRRDAAGLLDRAP
jgi:WD40 repeat protein